MRTETDPSSLIRETGSVTIGRRPRSCARGQVATSPTAPGGSPAALPIR
jgi:hypothetical protein